MSYCLICLRSYVSDYDRFYVVLVKSFYYPVILDVHDCELFEKHIEMSFRSSMAMLMW